MQHKGLFLSAAIIVVLAAAAALLLRNNEGKLDSLPTVRLGVSSSAVNGLIFIAHEQGFFSKRGVKVAMKTYETGVSAVNALVADAVDVATGAEFVMVRKGFDHGDLRAFAQIANTSPIEMIARKDRSIETVSDLRGKRVGLSRGSSSEFFLGGFLKRSDIPLSSLEMVNLEPYSMEKAFSDGSVDAIVAWEPHVTRIKERFGESVTSWPVQGRDDYYFLIMTKDQFLDRSPDAAKKMVRALLDAEEFARKHPEEVQRSIQERVKNLESDIRPILQRTAFHVRLDQSLITLMEAEAHWMIRNSLTIKKEMPNYLDMIYLKALKAVKPDAVGIIH
jgi:NitT/TauT family transport system substrate-binding protein